MSKLINITGKRFGFWLVKSRADNTKNGRIQWECICECGKLKNITTNSLRTGNSTSCGCNNNPDLMNNVFDSLTVIWLYKHGKDKSKRHWICKCICGNLIITTTNKLLSKKILSCGCKLKNDVEDESLTTFSKSVILDSANIIKEQEKIIIAFKKELNKSIELINKLQLKLV